MATHKRSTGIELTVPDNVAVTDTGKQERKVRRGRRPLPKGPIPLSPQAGDDWVVQAMAEQDLLLLDSFDLAPRAGATRRAGRAPSRLTVDVEQSEDAVVLLEQEGMYSWRFPEKSEVIEAPRTRRGPIVTPPGRRVTFDLSVEPSVPVGRGRRGPVADFLTGKVRTYVFRFVARVATGKAVAFLERKKRTGLVQLNVNAPQKWRARESLESIKLPDHRPARILLLVHGTFSSTVGSFGALGLTEWGRRFLGRARASYDVIIGYDHRTLSVDPLENAADLLARLERSGAPALELDAIAFSRGALVLRSLIEHLLPAAPIQARVRRAVFVGGTNAGTELAQPENWARLIDLTTNLFAMSVRVLSAFGPAAVALAIAKESIETVGALVKAIAGELFGEDGAPGLAAMVPSGRFITQINETQSGQPTAVESLYYAVSSEFDPAGVVAGKGAPEFPVRLARWVIDAVADGLIGEANDLVVNTASMTAIDMEAGLFVKDRWHFERNPHVYHTVYFTREEVIRALTRWLGLDADLPWRESELLPAGADEHVMVVSAGDKVGNIVAAARRSWPTFMIAERDMPWGERLRYAFRTEEVIDLAKNLSGRVETVSFEEAVEGTPFEMHEGTATPAVPSEAVLHAPASGGPTGERLIVMMGATPVAVIERGASMASSRELADVTSRAEQLRAASSAGRSRRPAPRKKGGGGARFDARRAAPKARRGLRKASVKEALGGVAHTRSMQRGSRKKVRQADQGTIFLAGEMPEEIALDATAPLSVVVSQSEILIAAGPTAASTKVSVNLDRTLVVQAIAKRNVLIEGEDIAEIDPRTRRTDLLFQVKGVDIGAGEIWVIARQGPVSLATLRLLPSIVAEVPRVPPKQIHAAADAQPADLDTKSYPLLQIFESATSDRFRYHFVLQLKPGDYVSAYSNDIKRRRDEYVAGVYKKIEERWLSTKGDFADFQEELRAYGGTLLNELVPASIQDALWKARDELKAIQVVAEEPFIPWELVHLKPASGPDGRPAPLPDERHFLGEKGLVRWLHNRGRAPLKLRVRRNRSYYVIPEYPHDDYKLPAAQEEIPFLKGTFGCRRLEPEIGAIRILLRKPGAVDHLHFSGHGEADAQAAIDAQLMLGGTFEDGEWVPRYLNADLIAETARFDVAKAQRPIVMLNACQVGRAGWRLSSIGGFAESFLRAGAGMFVGSLWAVGDEPARRFSEAFYKALVKGSPLSAAAIAGRRAAEKAEEGTWLAYVVYGYPYARIDIEK